MEGFNNMSAVWRVKVSILTFVLVFMSLLVPAIYAQDAPEGDSAGSGLNITPTRSELRVERGKVDVVSVSLKNVSGTDIIAKVFINDFESDDVSGEPRLITDPNKELATSIRRFLVGVTDVELAKDETKTFDIPVQIPDDASPGAYYGVVRYVASPKVGGSSDSGQVSLTASVGTLVLIEVPGDIKEQVQLRGVKIFAKDKDSTLFTRVPSQVGIELRNTGNTFSKPFGTVSVKNMFGKTVHTYELNDSIPKANILPNSTRLFKDELKGVNSPGRYVVTANISYANGGDILTGTKTFWLIPLWLIILLFVVVLMLLGGSKILYDKKFSRKRK